jgi:hypothetical protein
MEIRIVQLRESRSVIQDGVARAPEGQRSRDVAGQAKWLRGIGLHREPVIDRTRDYRRLARANMGGGRALSLRAREPPFASRSALSESSISPQRIGKRL